MKKTVAFMLVGILLMLVACAEDDLFKVGEKSNDDMQNELVSLTIKEATLTKTKATFMMENHTDETYTYGEPFSIEKAVDGVWHQLETVDELNFIAIGYDVEAKKSNEISIDWESTYGNLPNGTYRLVKYVFAETDLAVTDDDQVYIGAEFTIR